MAGIGVTLNRLFEKPSLTRHAAGFVYSILVTVAPMFLVIGTIILSQWALNYSDVDYAARELYGDTVLYIFIFSFLATSPFNTVLSRYLADAVFAERYDDIMPCFHIGLLINTVFGAAVALPFCIHEYVVGQVPFYYVFTGYCGFMAVLLVFYCMLYLSLTKDYVRMTGYYAIGMGVTFGLALFFNKLLKWEVTYSLLLSIVAGFAVIACLETALVQAYFKGNSRNYRPVLSYFRKFWQLCVVNFLYTLGLYIHNFVFWTTDDHVITAGSFVTNMPYDLATCLAMFTNISATIIFISRVEMGFEGRYRTYSDSVNGGRWRDISLAKNRMFRSLSEELLGLARAQFIITVVVFLLCQVLLPQMGFGGTTMRIYSLLCVSFFVLFLMYAEILFLYYFTDFSGAILTSILFCGVTLVGSIWSTHLRTLRSGSLEGERCRKRACLRFQQAVRCVRGLDQCSSALSYPAFRLCRRENAR